MSVLESYRKIFLCGDGQMMDEYHSKLFDSEGFTNYNLLGNINKIFETISEMQPGF